MKFYNSDAYKKKQTESIPLILQQLNGDTAAPTAQNPQPTTATAPTANASIKDAIQKIKEDAYIDGDKNARYTLLEYSDFECPYCKRHFQNGTVEALLAKYPTKINHIFRQYPLTSIHPYAEMAAEATECAVSLKNESVFYPMIKAIFELPTLSKEAVIAAAKNMGINEASMTTCIDNKTFSTKINDQTNEGLSLFGIRGTPGNVIVDNETGRYVVIAGAFPIEKFVQELENLITNE